MGFTFPSLKIIKKLIRENLCNLWLTINPKKKNYLMIRAGSANKDG
jgi:hypothetical protein